MSGKKIIQGLKEALGHARLTAIMASAIMPEDEPGDAAMHAASDALNALLKADAEMLAGVGLVRIADVERIARSIDIGGSAVTPEMRGVARAAAKHVGAQCRSLADKPNA